MLTGDRIVIADTNVVSYELKNLPIAREYERLIAGYTLHISFVTAAELHSWAKRHGWGACRRLQLQLFLSECPVVPYSKGMAEVFANVVAERRRAGRRMEYADAWIATTALYHDVPLVTNDEDFLHTRGLRVITASETVRAAQARLPVTMRPRPGLPLDMRCQCGL